MDLQPVNIKVKEATVYEQSVKSRDIDTFRHESKGLMNRHAQLKGKCGLKEGDSVMLSQPIVFDPLEHDHEVSIITIDSY